MDEWQQGHYSERIETCKNKIKKEIEFYLLNFFSVKNLNLLSSNFRKVSRFLEYDL